MVAEYKPCRDIKQVERDRLLPGLSFYDSEEVASSKRLIAIFLILTSIPEHDYNKLKASGGFDWFIPDYREDALLYPFPASEPKDQHDSEFVPEAKVLYLSPRLEKSTLDIAIAVVAHELAHLVLGHKLRTESDEEYQKQEDEVFEQICHWNYEKEAKKYQRVTSRWKSMGI